MMDQVQKVMEGLQQRVDSQDLDSELLSVDSDAAESDAASEARTQAS